ncbi:hypothetical protein BDV32DRAFT_116212 [Aspergillus pseudonomiae]|nr:hypothetical protein BDV32DRAFT_116212 [Aspergillus pseudonomiae]
MVAVSPNKNEIMTATSHPGQKELSNIMRNLQSSPDGREESVDREKQGGEQGNHPGEY